VFPHVVFGVLNVDRANDLPAAGRVSSIGANHRAARDSIPAAVGGLSGSAEEPRGS
jgi:hypothetical protein